MRVAFTTFRRKLPPFRKLYLKILIFQIRGIIPLLVFALVAVITTMHLLLLNLSCFSLLDELMLIEVSAMYSAS